MPHSTFVVTRITNRGRCGSTGPMLRKSKGGLAAALLFLACCDEFQRRSPFDCVGIGEIIVVDVAVPVLQWWCDREHECVDVVNTVQEPARLAGLFPRLDRRIQYVMQVGRDAECPPQAKCRAVAKTLETSAQRFHPSDGSMPPQIAFPVAVRVIADERVGQDLPHMIERLLRIHPLSDRLAPAHEVIQLVTVATPHHVFRVIGVPHEVRARLVRVFRSHVGAHSAPERAIGQRLRPSCRLAILRRQNAANHVFDFV